MNQRFFKDGITVFHCTDDGIYQKHLFKHTYFRNNKKINVIDKGQEGASTASITIPTEKELSIYEGDYVLEGIIETEFNMKELIKNHKIYKVLSVDDNRKGGLPHYKIGAKE